MRSVVCVICLMCAAPAVAQEYPAFYVRGELGGAEMHGTEGFGGADLSSLWGGVRVGRAFGRKSFFALDVGAAGGSSDGGFNTVTGGLELRAYPGNYISPFVRLEAGRSNESLGGCTTVGLGGGLSARLTRALSVRGGVLVSAHCWEGAGPFVASVGVEYRW